MDRFRRAPIVVLGLTLCATALVFAGQGKPITTPLSPAEMEAFLLKGKILEVRDAGSGVTGSLRAKVTDGTLTHDVHIQSVDIMKPVFQAGQHTEINFRDSYRYNIAGYRLSRLLGLDSVPMSVERKINGKPAAMTWWIDDVILDEGARQKKRTVGPSPSRTASQIHIMRVFDELIQNRDRNAGNLLWTSDWKMWMIDHTRAFRLGKDLLKPQQLERVDRDMFEKMRGLTAPALTETMDKSLTKAEIQALLVRRDAIVKLFDEKIAQRGEAAVFFTMPN